MYLARVLNFLKISNFKFWRRFRQPISKKIRNSKKITASEPNLARFTAILTSGNGGGMGGGAVLSLSATRCAEAGRQAGATTTKREGIQKRGESGGVQGFQIY
jgi:hypothetical protein